MLFLLLLDAVIKQKLHRFQKANPSIGRFFNNAMITTFLGMLTGFSLKWIFHAEIELSILTGAYEKIFLIVLLPPIGKLAKFRFLCFLS